MGVQGFNSKFISVLESRGNEMVYKCGAFFIDGNQLMFEVFALFKSKLCSEAKKGTYLNSGDSQEIIYHVPKDLASDLENIWTKIEILARKVIGKKLEIIKDYKKLEEIYIALDGTPCYGKIQQQMKRRKSSEKFYFDKKLFLTSAMTCPGTRYSNLFSRVFDEEFTRFVENYKNADGTYQIRLTKSLVDIPGEGEHKILDMVRHCKFVKHTKNDDRCVVIVSNDSDTVISLIHQNLSSVFVATSVFTNGVSNERIISLDDLSKQMSPDQEILRNMPLIISLTGNDFLPETLISQNFDIFYDMCLKLCVDPKKKKVLNLTTEIETEEGFVTVIDYENLSNFFGYIASIEAKMYTQPLPKTLNFREKPPLFLRPRMTTYDESELRNFKYKYYERFFISYHLYSKGTRFEEISEEMLLKFEIEVSLAYLKTFVWYFYYQSGLHVNKPLDNTYYEYCYPPLFTSLYMVLTEKREEFMINFSHEANKDLIPRERPLNYFENLKSFIHLHHYMILQKEEYELLYPNDKIFDKEVDAVKTFKNFEEKTIPLRGNSQKFQKFLEVYPFLDIRGFLERHEHHVTDNPHKIKNHGREKDEKHEKVSFSLFSTNGRSLDFGELPCS